MNLSALLPRFAHVGFLSPEARPQQAPAASLAHELRTLQRHATLPLANTRLQLQVLTGCVWITRDGCPADIVLEAGDIFEQHPGARVLVHALEPTELRLAAVGTQTQNPRACCY